MGIKKSVGWQHKHKMLLATLEVVDPGSDRPRMIKFEARDRPPPGMDRIVLRLQHAYLAGEEYILEDTVHHRCTLQYKEDGMGLPWDQKHLFKWKEVQDTTMMTLLQDILDECNKPEPSPRDRNLWRRGESPV